MQFTRISLLGPSILTIMLLCSGCSGTEGDPITVKFLGAFANLDSSLEKIQKDEDVAKHRDTCVEAAKALGKIMKEIKRMNAGGKKEKGSKEDVRRAQETKESVIKHLKRIQTLKEGHDLATIIAAEMNP